MTGICTNCGDSTEVVWQSRHRTGDIYLCQPCLKKDRGEN